MNPSSSSSPRSAKGTVATVLSVATVLTVICVLVAVVVSFVYAVAEPVYERNLQEQKNEIIATLFDGATVECQPIIPLGDGFADGVREMVAVFAGESLIGYCADVAVQGFGGEMELMVATDSTASRIIGVRVVAMSETPGLGAKVGEDDYLSRYTGLPMEEAGSVDLIAGASISSRAMRQGVKLATEAVLSVLPSTDGQVLP